ncbi:MAG TPA: glycogen synthase [Actinomycetales bacterium]|nr:glycogen synthase [Actinomycetales bacterium]
MRVAMMTREYPPEVYGGAGVHVTELVANLRPLCDVDVLCMGADRDNARAFRPEPELADANPAIQTLSAGLRMCVAAEGADLAHSHTWYAGLAGHLAGRLYGIPHVVSAHSLEPSRPWKAEQLGGGYQVSSWSEKNAFENADAVVAVSARMKDEILRVYPAIDPDRIHVILNGIDTSVWTPTTPFATDDSVLRRHGVDPDRPIVAFVGRITRQKGVPHLVRAAKSFHPDAQLVLCAGAPDTPEIAAEMEGLVAELQAERDGVFWLKDMLPRDEVIEILSAATLFVCPSVYEPLGIVNLEAMACDTAVVASDVGGIPEVVVDGETGTLVHYDESDPRAFEAGLAEAVNDLVADPDKAARFGKAGAERARTRFSWATIAEETHAMYSSLLK